MTITGTITGQVNPGLRESGWQQQNSHDLLAASPDHRVAAVLLRGLDSRLAWKRDRQGMRVKLPARPK